MLATATDALPADDDRWNFELKWDGVRALLRTGGHRLQVRSRNDLDITGSYPELTRLSLPDGLLLDGEIVALDGSGRPSFERLQRRMHVGDPGRAARLAEQVPVRFLAFDLLACEGHSLVDSPLGERRRLLETLDISGPHADVPPSWHGGGADVLAASRQQGLEGVVMKRADSCYEPGRRSRSWLKFKNLRTQEVVIGGWRPGAGRRTDMIGSLLLGVPSAAGLDYVGHVGTGFSQSMLRDLADELRPLRRADSPFAEQLPAAHRKDAQWVQPAIVGEVAFTEWTREGRLRHPTWRGLRADKSPAEVVRESS
jgi:bifunctional non-homologous end joining protein LigD